MEGMDQETNEPGTGIVFEGLRLPSGPPLTPQANLVTPPPISSQGVQMSAAQFHALTTAQASMVNQSGTMLSGGVPAAQDLRQLQTINNHQQQPINTSSAVGNQQNQLQVQTPIWNAQNQGLNQNVNQLGTPNTQPMMVADCTPNQVAQALNPFAVLKAPTTSGNTLPTPGNVTFSENLAPGIPGTGATSTTLPLQLPQSGTQQPLDNSGWAAYLSALSNQSPPLNQTQLNSIMALNNSMILAANNPQLTPNALQPQQQLVLNNPMAAFAPSTTPQLPLPGTRAYELLAVAQVRKHHVVKKDVERLQHLKSMKTKLVGKVFQPLNYRYASNYRTLEAIPGWNSSANKEKLRLWGLRGSERFRQTLLLEIEAELLKVKGRRDLVFHDEQNGSETFALVAQARKDLRI